jgi:hypothetical protein
VGAGFGGRGQRQRGREPWREINILHFRALFCDLLVLQGSAWDKGRDKDKVRDLSSLQRCCTCCRRRRRGWGKVGEAQRKWDRGSRECGRDDGNGGGDGVLCVHLGFRETL